MMNNQLVKLYKRSNMNNPKLNENEFIDLSSDDSNEGSAQSPNISQSDVVKKGKKSIILF